MAKHGTELPANLIVFAAGYGLVSNWAARLAGEPVPENLGECRGVGSSATKDPSSWKGEERNMRKPTQKEALWFHCGNLQ